MEEIRIDMRKQTPEEREQSVKNAQLCFKLNHTMPYTDEYNDLVKQLFGEFGEGSRLMAPTTVVRGKNVQRNIRLSSAIARDLEPSGLPSTQWKNVCNQSVKP